jgi:recombination protein RecT
MSDTKALTVREQQIVTLTELVGGDTAKAEKVWRIAANAVSKTPALKQVAREKLWLAIQDVAAMGLPFGGRGAYLVPYKADVTVIISPHGLIELMYRHPLVKSVQARVVREGEPCEVTYAPEAKITHAPSLGGTAGQMLGAYAIIELTTGGRVVEWMSRAEILKVKAISQSARSGKGPWADWEEEMWRKTVLKRAAKYVPQSEELMRAMDRDDADHDLTGAGTDSGAPIAPGVAGLKVAMASRIAAREVAETVEVIPTTSAVDTVDAEDVEIIDGWEEDA